MIYFSSGTKPSSALLFLPLFFIKNSLRAFAPLREISTLLFLPLFFIKNSLRAFAPLRETSTLLFLPLFFIKNSLRAFAPLRETSSPPRETPYINWNSAMRSIRRSSVRSRVIMAFALAVVGDWT